MIQYRRFAPMAAAAALLAALACNTTTDPTAPTVAAPSFASGQLTLGTPGDPNCRGQTTAYYAQYGKNNGQDYRGIRGLAASEDETAQEFKQVFVDDYCAGL